MVALAICNGRFLSLRPRRVVGKPWCDGATIVAGIGPSRAIRSTGVLRELAHIAQIQAMDSRGHAITGVVGVGLAWPYTRTPWRERASSG
jgi:hypothetical protein